MRLTYHRFSAVKLRDLAFRGRKQWTRLLGLCLTAVGGLCMGSQISAADTTDYETISSRRLTVQSDGTQTLEVVGSNLIKLVDSTQYLIDLDTLTDPDGNRYFMVGDTYQNEENGPVVYEVKLVRYQPHYLTEAELLESYLDVNPDATADEQEAFKARRTANSTLPEITTTMDDGVAAWYSSAASSDMTNVVLVLAEQPPLDLPKMHVNLYDEEPAFSLNQEEERILAIEQRKTDLTGSQAPLIQTVEASGGENLDTYWAVNAIKVRVPASVIDQLLSDSRIARIELAAQDEPSANYGQEIRDASQITQYLDSSVDGETSSRRATGVNDIYVGVIDSTIDEDHQGWLDTSGGSSRLVDVWDYVDGVWTQISTSSTSTSHGNKVAGQLIADLTDGQDPNYTSTADRQARTGMTTESSFSFIQIDAGGMIKSMEQAIELNVDIVNMSYNCSGCTTCTTDHSRNDTLDAAMKDGIFFVNTPANTGHSGSSCTVWVPGTASGSFTVNAYEKTATDLNSASLWTDSARGGDVHGRAIIDLTAISGREGTTIANYDNTYTTMGNGTSYAAPVVAGAAANLKDHLIDQFGTTTANEVGLLYAHMLLMGDGQMESGTQVASSPMDELWGAGRIRMRKFDNAGMDYPWRRRWFYGTLDDAEEYTIDLNPDGSSVNQIVPSDAEWFRAALWYHEPNLGSSQTPAEISLSVIEDGGTYTYYCSSLGPQMQRLWLGNVLSGRKWYVKITGSDVTASTESDYFYNEQKRKVFLAFYWEDRDRDDGDGPGSEIQ